MNSNSVGNIIQLITGFAVLIGLGLVIWELQQTRELALAQLVSDERLANIQKNLALMGENPAPTIVKGCLDPASLTAEEVIVYGEYLQIAVNADERKRAIQKVAGFDLGWERQIQSSMREFLGTKLGRLSYEDGKQSGNWPTEPFAIASELIESGTVEPCEIGLGRTLEALASEYDPRRS